MWVVRVGWGEKKGGKEWDGGKGKGSAGGLEGLEGLGGRERSVAIEGGGEMKEEGSEC